MKTANAFPLNASASIERLESAAVIFIILTMSFLPNLAKFGAPAADESGSIVGQLVYGSFYLYATICLIALRGRVVYLLARSSPLVLFITLLLFSTSWSTSPAPTFRNAIEMLGTTIIGLYIVSRFTLAKFLDLLVITFAIIAIACATLIVFAPTYGRSDYGASGWCGFYGEKNHFGTVMGLATVTALITAIASRGRKRFFSVIIAAFCAVLIVGSRSATASIVTLCTALTILIVMTCKSKKYGVFSIVGFSAIALMIGTFIAASGYNNDTFYSLVGRDSTLSGRADFWPGLVRAIADHPLFGYGYSAFFQPNGPADAYIGNATGWWHPSHAHNSFYQMMLDVGLIGSGIFAIVLIGGLFTGVRYFVRIPTAIASWPLAVIAFLLMGSFTETYFGMRNTTESVLFTAAVLYPMRRAFETVPASGDARPRNKLVPMRERIVRAP